MAEKAEEATGRFWYYYEKYFVAKQGKEEAEIRFYALMSLSQIHQIAGAPGSKKGAEVMHRLMGLVLTEDQSAEMYAELRKDSGVDPA